MSTRIFITGLEELRRKAQQVQDANRQAALEREARDAQLQVFAQQTTSPINELVRPIRSLLKGARPTAQREVASVPQIPGMFFWYYQDNSSFRVVSGDGSTYEDFTRPAPTWPANPYPYLSATYHGPWSAWEWVNNVPSFTGQRWQRYRSVNTVEFSGEFVTYATSSGGEGLVVVPASAKESLLLYSYDWRHTRQYAKYHAVSNYVHDHTFLPSFSGVGVFVTQWVSGPSTSTPEDLLAAPDADRRVYLYIDNSLGLPGDVNMDFLEATETYKQDLTGTTKLFFVSSTQVVEGSADTIFWDRVRNTTGAARAFSSTANANPSFFPQPAGMRGDLTMGTTTFEGQSHTFLLRGDRTGGAGTAIYNTPATARPAENVAATTPLLDADMQQILGSTSAGSIGVMSRWTDYDYSGFEHYTYTDGFNNLAASPEVWDIFKNTHGYTADDLFFGGDLRLLGDFYTGVGKPTGMTLDAIVNFNVYPTDHYFGTEGDYTVYRYADVPDNYTNSGTEEWNFFGDGTVPALTLDPPAELPPPPAPLVHKLVALEDRVQGQSEFAAGPYYCYTTTFGDAAVCAAALEYYDITKTPPP